PGRYLQVACFPHPPIASITKCHYTEQLTMSKSCDPLFRRDFLKTIGVAALPLLIHGCDVESPPKETFRAKPQGKGNGNGNGKGKPKPQPSTTTASVTVAKALTSQPLINDRQRCSLPLALSSMSAVGRQIR